MGSCVILVQALIFLLFAGSRLYSVEAASTYGLDTAIFPNKADPLASNDSFLDFSPSLKSLLSQLAHHDLYEKRQSLLSLETIQHVTVFLVGFPAASISRMRQNLEAIRQDTHVKVMGHEPHHLSVRTKVVFDLELRNELAGPISSAISNYMQQTSYQTAAPFMSIPHTLVDDIISSHINAHEINSYEVYLLNLKQQSRTYAYSYNPSEPSYMKCLGTHWTGNRRYLWVDLAAGPVRFGPNLAGEGLVTERSLPHAFSYSPAQQQNTYLADLTALVWSAVRMLLVPAIRTPVQFEQQTEIHFFHIQGTDLELLNSEDENATDIEQVKSTKGLQWDKIEAAILKDTGDSLLLAGQSLRFKRFSLQFSSCPLCVAAFTRSLTSYTSRFFLEEFSLFVHEYLDSKQLHVLLSEYSEEISEKAGVPMKATSERQPRIIPVYIFDIDADKHLVLDRFHQVIPFRDMVIAVRSKVMQMLSDYSCNGRPSILRIQELERPLVGALLQTVWGVSPTHLTWSAQHNSTYVDYRWGVGQTPFGPFSELLSLSFAQKDAARRNVLYSMLNSTVANALLVLEAIDVQGGEKNLFSSSKKLLEYTQRWNLYVYKLNKAVSAISHFDFDSALFYLRSSEHDIYAVQSMVYVSSSELEASIVCFQDPPFPWLWIASLSALFVIVVYLWIKRDQIFASKRKVF